MSCIQWWFRMVVPMGLLVGACTDNAAMPPQQTAKLDAGVADAGGMEDAGEDAASDSSSPWQPPPWSDPIWEILPESPVGCAIERLRAMPDLSAFAWAPCESQAGCEQMKFPPWLSSNTTSFDNATIYATDMYTSVMGTVVTLTLSSLEWSMSLIVRQDGTVIDGFRVKSESGLCRSFGSSVWKTNFGLLVRRRISQYNGDFGGFIGSITDPKTLKMFEHKPGPPGMGAAFLPMAESRWLWTNSCKYVTVSAVDGLDLQTAAICGDSTLHLSYMPTLTETGTRFLFAETWTPDKIIVKSRIVWTDGVSPLTPFIEPSDDSFYEDPTYAHSHIAWARGVGPKDVGLFDAVEIWASKYSDDPSQIVPYKVGDHGLKTSIGYIRAGGFGRLALLSGADAPAYNEFVVWDLENKTKRLQTLPEGRQIVTFWGMTSTHVWVTGRSQPGKPVDAMYRFQVQP
jgi:hypothetical protein